MSSSVSAVSLPAWGVRRRPALLALAAALILAMLGLVPFAARPAAAAGPLVSQGKPVSASSVEGTATPAAAAVDGNTGTRWASVQGAGTQWIQVDLGTSTAIDQVVLNWEAAYATSFQIQTASAAAGPWTNIYSTTTGTGGVQTLAVVGTGRFVRVNATVRATPYGYSVWEFQVFGGTTTATGQTIVGPGGKCVDVAGDNAGVNNAAVQLWDCLGTAATDQYWTRNGTSLRSLGRCLDVVAGGTANGAQVQLYDCNGSGAQQWTQEANGTMRNTGSGRCLDSPNAATANGTRLTIYDCNGSAAQIFRHGTTPIGCTAQPNIPDFGPNTVIFSPTTPTATIQTKLDEAFNAQKDTLAHQVHPRRDALLFKPGTYNSVFANIGFNTQIAGLGLNPDDVRINGAITVDAFNASDQGNATQNFWRSVENISVNTNGGSMRWGVSQAAPMRRVHVIGNLDLFPASYGWSSGGYISDSRIDGTVNSGSQQQWFSMNSNWAGWNGSNWNMVFSGVVGAPPTNFSTDPAGLKHTNVGNTPTSRDVPYIYVDGTGNYRIFVPSLRTNASGASWPNTPGTSIPFSNVFVARPSDSAATINARLNDGCHLVFTPGIYNLTQTINVNRANTVVLGMGYATLIPQNGITALQVGDVDGVRVKGMFIDAGTTNSNSLMTVGTTAGIGTSRAANPVTVQDVFFRIGGSIAGKATNSLVVNSSNTIIDHTWLWRADHGNNGTWGWTINTADTGLVVNGNNVLATGLFVEHYQKYEVIWNGQGGRIIFFQNEKPYDPPNQAAYMNGTQNGWASIKVANNVTSFLAQGLGAYTFFNVNPSVNLYHAFEAPVNANVRFTNMALVSLGGVGSITRTINDAGPGVNSTTNNAYFLSYP